MPKELTLTRSAFPWGQGSTSVGTCSFHCWNGTRKISLDLFCRGVRYSLFGLGVLKLIFGGTMRCSSARMPLIRLVSPAAPSEWPTFGLTCRQHSG